MTLSVHGLPMDLTVQMALYKHEMEQKLKRSETKFRSLYSSMSEGVCLHEIIYNKSGKAIDYRIIDVNPAYELIINIKREKAVGSKPSLAIEVLLNSKDDEQENQFSNWQTPHYIKEGLEWLRKY